jgi:hypothetical protein
MKWKKYVLVAAALLGFLVGCGNTDSQKQGSAAPTGSAPDANAAIGQKGKIPKAK